MNINVSALRSCTALAIRLIEQFNHTEMLTVSPNVHPQTRLRVQVEPSLAPTDTTLTLRKYFELVRIRFGYTTSENEVLRFLSLGLQSVEPFLSDLHQLKPLQILVDQCQWLLARNSGGIIQLSQYCKSLTVQYRSTSATGKVIHVAQDREWTQFFIDYQGLYHPKRFQLLGVTLISQLLQGGVHFINHPSLNQATHRVRHLLDVEKQQLIRQKYFEINPF